MAIFADKLAGSILVLTAMQPSCILTRAGNIPSASQCGILIRAVIFFLPCRILAQKSVSASKKAFYSHKHTCFALLDKIHLCLCVPSCLIVFLLQPKKLLLLANLDTLDQQRPNTYIRTSNKTHSMLISS